MLKWDWEANWGTERVKYEEYMTSINSCVEFIALI